MSEMHIPLDPKLPGRKEAELLQLFRDYMISQDKPVRHLVRKINYANSLNGKLRDSTKPAGTCFYLGPSGVGKTRLVEVFAKLMFGNFEAFTRIDCSELQHSHEISRLIGAPPGYLGFNLEPWLTQRKLDYWGFRTGGDSEKISQLDDLRRRMDEADEAIKILFNEAKKSSKSKDEESRQRRKDRMVSYHSLLKHYKVLVEKYKILENSYEYKPGAYPCIILFDEIEKANPTLFQLLLQVHDKARLTLHSHTQDGNPEVYFQNAFIFYTSNIGQEEIRKLVSGGSIGFTSTSKSRNLGTDIYHRAMKKMESTFSTELIGRIGKENIVVFSPLTAEDLREELERIRIPDFLRRIGELSISVRISDQVKDYLVKEARDLHNLPLGLRALKNVFAKRIEEVVTSLISKDEDEGGVIPGDTIDIGLRDGADGSGELEFSALRNNEASGTIKAVHVASAYKGNSSSLRRVATFRLLKKS